MKPRTAFFNPAQAHLNAQVRRHHASRRNGMFKSAAWVGMMTLCAALGLVYDRYGAEEQEEPVIVSLDLPVSAASGR